MTTGLLAKDACCGCGVAGGVCGVAVREGSWDAQGGGGGIAAPPRRDRAKGSSEQDRGGAPKDGGPKAEHSRDKR